MDLEEVDQLVLQAIDARCRRFTEIAARLPKEILGRQINRALQRLRQKSIISFTQASGWTRGWGAGRGGCFQTHYQSRRERGNRATDATRHSCCPTIRSAVTQPPWS